MDTPNLKLPEMEAAQSQKHITHNEALIVLDGVVQLSVKSRGLTAPPVAVDGDRYIIGSGATGAWAGKDLNVAMMVDGSWRFLIPGIGWLSWVEDESQAVVWKGAPDYWQAFSGASGPLIRQRAWEDASAPNATGGTSEVVLETVTLPGGCMGPNGRVRITSLWSATQNANAKTCRIRFGASTAIWFSGAASNAILRTQTEVANTGAENSQIAGVPSVQNGWGGQGSVTIPTTTVDTSADFEISFRGQLATGTDDLKLRAYIIEVFYGA